MIKLLELALQSFWHFVGTFLILYLILIFIAKLTYNIIKLIKNR